MAKVKVEGLRELEKQLAQLPKATAKNVLVRTLKKAAKPMRDDAAANAPVLTGGLRDSVVVTTKKPPGHDAGKNAYAAAMKQGLSRKEAGAALRAARAANPNAFAEVFLGPSRSQVGKFQEFGTRFHQPQPFMRPAWDAKKNVAVNIIRDEMSDEIMKAVKRLAKKAAKARG